MGGLVELRFPCATFAVAFAVALALAPSLSHAAKEEPYSGIEDIFDRMLPDADSVPVEEDPNTVDGSEAAFARIREMQHVDEPGYDGDYVEDVIAKFFPEAGEDEGTYPLSEALEHDFDLRRTLPERLAYTGDLYFKYSKDQISSVEKWEKELVLNLDYENYSAYLRFSDVNPFAYSNDPMRWEKGQLRYKHDTGKVTVGSYGALFGRGLALNMFEERFLDFDNEVEGLKVEQQVGEVELTALTGTRKLRSEFHHASVQGFRAAMPLADDLDVGVDCVNVKFADTSSTAELVNMLDYDITALDLAWSPGDFKFAGETIGVKREETTFGSPFDLEGRDGKGYYINGGYSVPGVSISAEYKDYVGLNQPFMVAPPIRRWVEKASADPNDDVGYGFDLNLSPGDGNDFFNFHYAQDNSQEGGRPYTEFLSSYNSPTDGPTNYIAEYWKVNDFDSTHEYQRLTVNHTIDEDYSATTFLERERRGFGFKPGFNDYIFEGEIAFRSEWNLIYTHEMSLEETDKQTRWRLWEFRYRPDENQEINIAVGSRRAGFVCSGGICREEPAFDGLKVDYLLRF